MRVGRVASGAGAALAVAACALVVVGMGRATQSPHAAANPTPSSVDSVIPAFITTPAAETSSLPAGASTGALLTPTSPANISAGSSLASGRAATAAGRAGTTTASSPARIAASRSRGTPAPAPAGPPAPATGSSLPVGGSTSGASRVITVVASSYASTSATLQAWNRAPGGGWLRYGPAILAHVGSEGLTTSPSEFKSATPIGSFTLTQAFGRLASPGGLPYFQTTPADWWISQQGPLYNTHQRCSGSCGFTQGDPNEHLYYETPYYNYAVVINTPAGAAAYPHGSAFFLHVTDGSATAGCVAIPQGNLVTIMKWLVPSAHPRILIGIA